VAEKKRSGHARLEQDQHYKVLSSPKCVSGQRRLEQGRPEEERQRAPNIHDEAKYFDGGNFRGFRGFFATSENFIL